MSVLGVPVRAVLALALLSLAGTATAATPTAHSSVGRDALNWELLQVTAAWGPDYVTDLQISSTLVVQPDRTGPFVLGSGFAYPAADMRDVSALKEHGGDERTTVQVGPVRWEHRHGSAGSGTAIGDNLDLLNKLAPGQSVYVLNMWAHARISTIGHALVTGHGRFTVRRVLGGGTQALDVLDTRDTGSGVVNDGTALGWSSHTVQATTGIVGAFPDDDTTGFSGAHAGIWVSPDGRSGTQVIGDPTTSTGAGVGTSGIGFAGPAGTWQFQEALGEQHNATPVVVMWAPIGAAWALFETPMVPRWVP